MTETYYSRNRAKRLAYQKTYYSLMHGALKRKRELKNFLEPEKIEFLRAYNRAYYLNNRARIHKKRADTAEKRKKASRACVGSF